MWGTCPPHFFRRGNITCYVPPMFFSLGFVFGETAKTKMTFVTYHVRCTAKPSWRWNRVSCGITDSNIFISFCFYKMIFSILQVSRGHERLSPSVQHFALCGISAFYSNHWLYTVRKRSLSWNNKSLTAARVRDHRTAMICFVQKCNWLCCNVGCHINLKMQIYNVKKLHLQANLYAVFCWKQKAELLWKHSFSLGLAVLQKTVFNH